MQIANLAIFDCIDYENSAERYFRPKKGGVPRASTIPGRKVSQGGYSAFVRASRIALLPHWNGQA